MKFRQFRLQGAEGAEGSTGSAALATTLMTDSTNTAPAVESSAPAGATGADPAVEGAAAAPADAQKAADDAAALKASERTAPEKYELKAPEGATLDPEALGEFEGIARELNLSQEDAQKVADIGAKLAQKWGDQQAQSIQAAAAEWAASATADKEYGGDKLPESLATAKKALDAFGTPELRSLLNDSRLGNHPEVIRFMVRAGKAISEDRMVTGGAGPATASANVAKSLYPNQS